MPASERQKKFLIRPRRRAHTLACCQAHHPSVAEPPSALVVVPPPLSSNTAPQPQPTKSQRDLPTPRFAPTALLSCPLERSTPWSENELCGVATLVGGGSNDGEAPHFGLLSVEATMAGGGKAGLVGRRSVLARGEAQEVCCGCRGGFLAPDHVGAATKHRIPVTRHPVTPRGTILRHISGDMLAGGVVKAKSNLSAIKEQMNRACLHNSRRPYSSVLQSWWREVTCTPRRCPRRGGHVRSLAVGSAGSPSRSASSSPASCCPYFFYGIFQATRVAA